MRRKQFVKLVEDVKAYGGEVLMFSSMHESGQRASSFLSARPDQVLVAGRTPPDLVSGCRAELNQLTGIAAILTYPLDIEVVEEEERQEAEDRRIRAEAEEEDVGGEGAA